MRLGASLCLLLLAGCGDKPSAETVATDPPKVAEKKRETVQSPVITQAMAMTLFNEYRDNVIQADSKYTGKVVDIYVSGKIKKDAKNRYYIGQHTYANADDVTHHPGVLCYLSDQGVKAVAKAKPGESFRIRGTCKGRKDNPRVYQGYFITIDNCDLVAFVQYKGNERVESPLR